MQSQCFRPAQKCLFAEAAPAFEKRTVFDGQIFREQIRPTPASRPQGDAISRYRAFEITEHHDFARDNRPMYGCLRPHDHDVIVQIAPDKTVDPCNARLSHGSGAYSFGNRIGPVG